MSDTSSQPRARPRRRTIFAAALLLIALGMVVIYTSRGAFLSPVAVVVVAAIGLAALMIQLRLRSGSHPPVRGSMVLNMLGVVFALGAVFSDILRLTAPLTLVAALGAVISFGISGIIVLAALRRSA